MSIADTESSEGTDSLTDLRPAPLNFSRPRPISVNSKERLYHDRSSGSNVVGGTNAFHEPNKELPNEPRFSLDSQRTESDRSSENSAASMFAWDGHLGELQSKRRPNHFEQQRYSGGSSIRTSRTASSNRPPVSELPGSHLAPPIPAKDQRIVKHVAVDQRSERISLSTRGDWEDDASHHTVSEAGEGGYTSEEIRKLRKKGINPALYAEMKAARKGKGKFIGPLVGNTYIG